MSPGRGAASGRRHRPANLSWKRHIDTCPDCLDGHPCRTAEGYAKRADIEDGGLMGWADGWQDALARRGAVRP